MTGRCSNRFILATQRSKLPHLQGRDKKMERYLSATLKDHKVWMKLIARRLGPRGGPP
jgi:hypothetical protein